LTNKKIDVLLKTPLSLFRKEEKLKLKKFGAYQPRDHKYGQRGKEYVILHFLV
jgi:hypothetical protein